MKVKLNVTTRSSIKATLATREPAGAAPMPDVSRAARQLALAYWIERKVEVGELDDYAHAARVLGITRARVSQLMNLLGLSAAVQEDVLRGSLDGGERELKRRA